MLSGISALFGCGVDLKSILREASYLQYSNMNRIELIILEIHIFSAQH